MSFATFTRSFLCTINNRLLFVLFIFVIGIHLLRDEQFRLISSYKQTGSRTVSNICCKLIMEDELITLGACFLGDKRITTKELETLRFDGVKRLRKVVLNNELTGDVIINQLVELLQQCRGEFEVLASVKVRSNVQVLEAIADLIKDVPTVRKVSFKATVESRGMIIPDGVLTAIHNLSELKSLCLENFAFTSTTMRTWASDLRELGHLKLNYIEWKDDSWSQFVTEILPSMTLREFQFCQDMSNVQTKELFRSLRTHQNLEYLGFSRRIRSEPSDAETIATISCALQSMPMLDYFHLRNVMTNQIADWSLLGRSLANCAQLDKLGIRNKERFSREATRAFIRELGFPSRLSSRFSLGDSVIEAAFLRVLRSHRAKCLTVLLCGATVERVGKHSVCWRIPRDVFRRLCPYLPLYNK